MGAVGDAGHQEEQTALDYSVIEKVHDTSGQAGCMGHGKPQQEVPDLGNGEIGQGARQDREAGLGTGGGQEGTDRARRVGVGVGEPRMKGKDCQLKMPNSMAAANKSCIRAISIARVTSYRKR